MADLPPYPGTPRWVKVSAMVAAAIVVLIAFVIVTGVGGPHGPARHMQSSNAGGAASLNDATQPGSQSP
jgi:hypothetical protein